MHTYRFKALKLLGASLKKSLMYLTSLTKVKICNTSATAIGRASNTSDFYKALYPFDGIFDNSFISFHVRRKKKRKKEKRKKERTDLYFQQRILLLTLLLYFVILSP